MKRYTAPAAIDPKWYLKASLTLNHRIDFSSFYGLFAVKYQIAHVEATKK